MIIVGVIVLALVLICACVVIVPAISLYILGQQTNAIFSTIASALDVTVTPGP